MRVAQLLAVVLPSVAGTLTDRSAAIARLLDNHIEPAYRVPCGAMLRGEAFTFAQAWQDWTIFHNHFADRLEWGGGSYVDIGTNHPSKISSTFFFDKCLGWRGVCFEPMHEHHGRIRRERSCTLIPSCVLGSERDVLFSGGGTTGAVKLRETGATDKAGGAPNSKAGGASDDKAGGAPGGKPGGRRLRCVGAAAALRAVGMGNGSTIDLLSIDVEGAEADV